MRGKGSDWRTSKSLPEQWSVGIFSRSHYEEVLVVRAAARAALGGDAKGATQ